MYHLTCQYCQVIFTRNRKTYKYCSKRCAYDDRIGKPRHPNAGKKRTKIPRKFICEYCNKSFEKQLTPSDKSKFSFCSPTCRNKARKIDNVSCPVCGKMFKPTKYILGKRKKHCSNECRLKGRKHGEFFMTDIEKDIAENYPKLGPDPFMKKYNLSRPAVCDIANRQGVKLLPEEYNKRVHQAAKRYMESSNNPNWQGGITHQIWGEDWERQRKEALERDKYKCQVCFKKGNIVHHIKPRRLFNDNSIKDMNKLSNLITLCDKHHVPIELGKIPCPKPMEF